MQTWNRGRTIYCCALFICQYANDVHMNALSYGKRAPPCVNLSRKTSVCHIPDVHRRGM